MTPFTSKLAQVVRIGLDVLSILIAVAAVVGAVLIFTGNPQCVSTTSGPSGAFNVQVHACGPNRVIAGLLWLAMFAVPWLLVTAIGLTLRAVTAARVQPAREPVTSPT